MRALFLAVAVASVLSADRIEVKREDGGLAVGYFDAPKNEKFPIALVVQGAQAASVRNLHEQWKKQLLEKGYCIVSLEKAGIGAEGVDREAFDQSNTIDQRISDHAALIAALKKGLVEGWNGAIDAIGITEGAVVAASLAVKFPEVRSLALLCCAGGWSKTDELVWSFRKQMAAEGFDPGYIHSVLIQSKQGLQEAVKDASSKRQSFGYPNKYWASIVKYRLLDLLSETKCPVYLVQGTLDDQAPPESADYLVRALKEQGRGEVVYQLVEGLAHDPAKDPAVFGDTARWISTGIILRSKQ